MALNENKDAGKNLNQIMPSDTPASNINDVVNAGQQADKPTVKQPDAFDIRRTNDTIGEVYKKYEPYYLHMDENQRQTHFDNVKKGFESGQYSSYDQAKTDIENAVVSGLKSRMTSSGLASTNNFQADLNNYKTLKKSEQEFFNASNKYKQQQNAEVKQTNTDYLAVLNDFNNKKDEFKNPDEVIDKFRKVTDYKRGLLATRKDGVLTQEDINKGAADLGMSQEYFSDPTKLFQTAELSEKGLINRGVVKFNNDMQDSAAAQDKNLNDAFVNLENNSKNIDEKLLSVGKQMDQSIEYLEAQGAASGGYRNSAYTIGITNVKNESMRTMQQLKDMRDKVMQAHKEDVADMTNNYNLAVDRATQDFNQQIKDIKYNMGVQIGGLAEKYGAGNNVLGNMLDKIYQEYQGKTEMAFSRVQAVFQNINSETEKTAKALQDLQDKAKARADQRYNEYLNNNGQLLSSSGIGQLQSDFKSGKISLEKYRDLVSIMSSSVLSTLKTDSPYANIGSEKQKEIDMLISNGYSPKEIVSMMQSSYKDLKPYNKELESAKMKFENDMLIEDYKFTKEQMKPRVISKDRYGNDVYGTYDGEKWVPINVNMETSGPKRMQISNVGKNTLSFDDKVQCGQAYNRIAKTGSKQAGDSIESKIAIADITGEKLISKIKGSNDGKVDLSGYGFVSDSEKFKDNGHIGYILKDLGDGTYDVFDANYNGDEKQQIRRGVKLNNIVGLISKDSPNGVDQQKTMEIYKADAIRNVESEWGMSYDDAKDLAERVAAASGFASKEERTFARKEQGLSSDDMMIGTKTNMPLTDKGVEHYYELYKLAAAQRDEVSFWNTGAMRTDLGNDIAARDVQMSAMLTLTSGYMDKMKGSLSDGDRTFLQAAASGFNLEKNTTDGYKKGMDALMKKIEERAKYDAELASRIGIVSSKTAGGYEIGDASAMVK